MANEDPKITEEAKIEEKNKADEAQKQEKAENYEKMEQELNDLKTQNEDLATFKQDTLNKELLRKSGVKNHAQPYISKLLDGKEDKGKEIENLKKVLPELFKSKAINISNDFKNEDKIEKTEKEELKELNALKRKSGG